MRFSLNSPDDAPYDRPQQAWRCGLSHEGMPCPAGPTLHGHCPGATACHPLRDGDRWRCNRSPLRGGPCGEGPSPDGVCAITHRCTPFRSLRSRRGQLVTAAAVAALGALAMAMSAEWKCEAIVPGPLSVHHAQLFAAGGNAEFAGGGDAPARCAACHEASRFVPEPVAPNPPPSQGGARGGTAEIAVPDASQSNHIAELKNPSPHPSLQGRGNTSTQTSLCMTCHDKHFAVAWATRAHSLPVTQLVQKPLGSPRRDPEQPITCSACHREHQGRDFDLTAIDDAACQACHAERFASLADGHPEFTNWPARRRTPIAFDHAGHQSKHFPEKQREFACTTCHELRPADGAMTTRGYEFSCRECHDATIAASLQQGIGALVLPTLDVDALADAGQTIGDWPEEAQGDFDGALSPIAKLLVAADADGAEGLAELGARFDFFDVDFEDDQQLAAAAKVVAAYKRALARLAAGDPQSLDLFPGLDAATVRKWLEETLPDANVKAPSAATSQVAGAPRASLPRGSWRQDPNSLALRYLPAGHADAALTAWLDALAAAASDTRAAVADPLLRDLTKPTAPGQCGSCHSLDRDVAGKFTIQWRAAASHARDDNAGRHVGSESLTRFSHAPHLTQQNLRDCTACHQLVPGAEVLTTYAHDDPAAFTPAFAPLEKSDCTACHRPQAAGNACTQCHKYHGGAGR